MGGFCPPLAAEALANGIDSPGPRELAGPPLKADGWEVRDALSRTFAELGLGIPNADDARTQWLALRRGARWYLAAQFTSAQFCAWVPETLGFQGIPEAEAFRDFAYRFECADLHGSPPSDADVRAAVASILTD